MTRTCAALLLMLVSAVGLSAKDKGTTSNEFDAPAARVYDAVYRYAQHHGTIKWSDEKRFTLSGSMSIAGGKWDWRKDFDCTISVEASKDGKKSVVDVVGTFPAKQQSLVGAFGEGPAVKVLKGIREEFDNLPEQSSGSDVEGKAEPSDLTNSPSPSIREQSAQREHATLDISSSPPNADIELDGSFVGNTPSSLGVATGDHILKISKAGYRIWERNVRSLTGTVRINAELEATTVAGVVNPSPQVGSTRVDRQSASTPASTPAPGVKSETAGAAPISSTELNQETSIGVWFVGKPTVRHDGVEVSGVQQGGPAEELGIKAGDVILAIDEHYVFTIQELHTELRSHPDGSRVGIRYRRGSLIYENYIILKRKPG